MTENEPTPEVKQLRLVVEAEDFEQAVVFYRDVLGLREEFSVASEGGALVVALQAGRATLEIVNPAQRRPSVAKVGRLLGHSPQKWSSSISRLAGRAPGKG
jgi:hypothetical protein